MDAAEYKHTVLGLIFLKYISDAFDEHHARLIAGEGEYEGADPEDPDEYRAENVFWVPTEARWKQLQASAKQPTIGKLIDDAMDAIERDNPKLKGMLTKNYARPALDKQRLGELIDLIGTIEMIAPADEDYDPAARDDARAAHRSKDILGRVYEYFLSSFASAEGKKGGQFYTPSCVVRTLVEMLAPYKGRIYDPACGSGGMFVQADKFIKAQSSSNGNGKKVSSKALAAGSSESRNRDRRGETLFIDARKQGTMIDRVHRELTDADIQRLADTYHAWQRQEKGNAKVQSREDAKKKVDEQKKNTKVELGDSASSRLCVNSYSDIPGFCKSVKVAQIAEHGHVLTPGRYVGAEEVEDGDEPFEDKLRRLVGELGGQFEESSRLERAIKSNLEALGFDGCVEEVNAKSPSRRAAKKYLYFLASSRLCVFFPSPIWRR